MMSVLLLFAIDFSRNWQQNLAMDENQTAGHVTIETPRLPIPEGVAIFFCSTATPNQRHTLPTLLPRRVIQSLPWRLLPTLL
jgi:hypothetical protein